MKLRISLYAQMLVWFFLNLLMLAAVFVLFFSIQFSVGLDSLLLGHAGERIQRTSNVIEGELRDAPASQWDAVLKRFGDAYGLEFYLFRPDATQLSGKSITLPPEVRARLIEHVRPGPGQQLPGRPRFQPLPEPPEPPETPGPPAAPGMAAPPPDGTLPHQRRIGPPHVSPKFMVRTSNPTRYWVGVPFRPLPREDGPGQRVMVLLAESESLSGSGLFIDTKPWIMMGFGAVALSILFWFPLARGFSRAISQMTHATEEIASGRFDVRVKSRRPDELGRLGEAINQMASRLSGFVMGQKRFLGDIAHELCSPIARIQLLLGILEERDAQEAGPKADPARTSRLNDLREEVQEMSGLVNELLSFSKASLRPESVKLQPVALRPLVEQAARREAGDADAIEYGVAPETRVLADPDLLLRALANLLRNAVRYAGSAGPISISATVEDGTVLIRVSDCGPGVPAESLPLLFDPFYRPELARARETGGAGLGLAIVKTCIESCQGSVTCRNRDPKGFEVEIKLMSC